MQVWKQSRFQMHFCNWQDYESTSFEIKEKSMTFKNVLEKTKLCFTLGRDELITCFIRYRISMCSLIELTQVSWGLLKSKDVSTMLFLLWSSLALESKLSKRVPRKRKPLGHSVLCPFIMHPVSYFHCAVPYLALRSLSLNLPMQAAEAVWGKTANTNTNVHLSIKDWPYFVSWQRLYYSITNVKSNMRWIWTGERQWFICICVYERVTREWSWH